MNIRKRDNHHPRKAVVLLSGGLDSATMLFLARKQGYDCRCLLFDYGQRHVCELRAARRIARAADSPITVVRVPLPWSESSLTDTRRDVPAGTASCRRGPASRLPSTYVPGRNTIFISFALSYAEAAGASAIFIGANAVDFSGYPDCRPVYYRAWDRMAASLGTRIRVKAPLIRMTKSQIVRLGMQLGVPYGLTWSCYRGGAKPCGVCDSCLFRSKGFAEAGFDDPALRLHGRERP